LCFAFKSRGLDSVDISSWLETLSTTPTGGGWEQISPQDTTLLQCARTDSTCNLRRPCWSSLADAILLFIGAGVVMLDVRLTDLSCNGRGEEPLSRSCSAVYLGRQQRKRKHELCWSLMDGRAKSTLFTRACRKGRQWRDTHLLSHSMSSHQQTHARTTTTTTLQRVTNSRSGANLP
jgi:hypothetical protein